MSTISAETLIDQIKANAAPLIIDVRSTREFDEGHVPGARHIPFWQITAQAETLAAFRERPIVVYCGHGPRAYSRAPRFGGEDSNRLRTSAVI